jgi:formate-dependent nitrite reductase cytochrome c552 subunit
MSTTRQRSTNPRHERFRSARIKGCAPEQRQAQWRLDFVAAENSMGFHAAQELARILAESIDLSRQAELAAVRLRASVAPAPPAGK